ncbi:hypothetical protein ACWCXB_14395 [Streptomyces sp. NPDC001514]
MNWWSAVIAPGTMVFRAREDGGGEAQALGRGAHLLGRLEDVDAVLGPQLGDDLAAQPGGVTDRAQRVGERSGALVDVTVAELRMEAFLPADEETARLLGGRAERSG